MGKQRFAYSKKEESFNIVLPKSFDVIFNLTKKMGLDTTRVVVVCYIFSSKLMVRYEKGFNIVMFNIGHKDSSHSFVTCNLITGCYFSKSLVYYDNAYGSRGLLASLTLNN